MLFRQTCISHALKILLITTQITKRTVSGSIIVKLPNGLIRGRQDISPDKKIFYAFEKVPYAAPPVGNLRFQPPVPPRDWPGTLNTTKYDSTCFETGRGDSKFESEDCLYLNVYTPQLPRDDHSDNLLAVMVFIHGGGFSSGNCFRYGPNYLVENDVIVVTFDYRLGPFGFLSTEDLVAPGNNGLKDQLFAIKWVHNNIKLFGGDPEKITIFGESSGGVSVGLHLLNLKSIGLFRGAITQSGSSLSPTAIQRRAREKAFELGTNFNKTLNNSQELLDFLKTVPAEDLNAAAAEFLAKDSDQIKNLMQGLYYAPVIEPKHDGSFISEKMYVSLKNGDFIKVPLLTGFNSEEAISFALDLDGLRNISKNFDENLTLLVPGDMKITNDQELNEMGHQIRKMYVGNSTFQENLGRTIRFLTDSVGAKSDLKHAELISKSSRVYFYKFSYDGELGNLTVPTNLSGTDGSVNHFEDIHYLFYIKGENSDLSKFPAADRLTQRRMQKIWTDFAKTLNPTPAPSELLQNLRWPKVNERRKGNKKGLLYVNIDKNLTIRTNPKGNIYKEWNKLYSGLGFNDYDTY